MNYRRVSRSVNRLPINIGNNAGRGHMVTIFSNSSQFHVRAGNNQKVLIDQF